MAPKLRVVNPRVSKLGDLPAEWLTPPSVALVSAAAETHGVPPSEILDKVAVEVHEHPLFVRWQQFCREAAEAQGGDDVLPVVVVNSDDYQQAHGRGSQQAAVEEFLRTGLPPRKFMRILYPSLPSN